MMRGLHVVSLWLSLVALAAGFRAPSVTGHCGVPALAACAKESLSRRSLLAVVLAGSRRATGSTAQSPALACAVEGSGGGDTAAAMAEVDALIAQRAGASRFTLTPKSAAMEDAIQTLRACNPTDAPGVWDSPEKTRRLADGEWHVLYAPHMFRLQTLLATEFGPRYILESRGGQPNRIVSNVRYESSLFGNGWLNAAGTFDSVSDDTVEIKFERFWWDRGADEPSPDPMKPRSDFVQALGHAGFLESFSRFPVKYVDERLCEFVFGLSGTSILAVKVRAPED